MVGQPVHVGDDEAREGQQGHARPPDPEQQVNGRQLERGGGGYICVGAAGESERVEGRGLGSIERIGMHE